MVVRSTDSYENMAEYGQLHCQFLFAGPHDAPRATAVEVARV